MSEAHRPTSVVDIWNLALLAVGETDLLQAVEESGNVAQVCRLNYYKCLEQLLACGHPWSFALKHGTLSQLEDTTRTGWEYVYSVPTDCLLPLALLAEDERVELKARGERLPYRVMLGDDGASKILCTDYDNGDDEFDVLEYVTNTARVTLMSAEFIDALVHRLAMPLALGIAKKPALAKDCYLFSQQALAQAIANDAGFMQERADNKPTTRSIAARG